MTVRSLFLGLLLMTTACVAPTSVTDNNLALTIVYSGNLDGELEPCGCTLEGDFGGILRRVTMVDQLRQQVPELFLISAGGLLLSESPMDRLRAEYILKGFTPLDYDAIALQWRDLAYGNEFILADELPWVASNWLDSTFAPTRVISHGDIQLAFFNWLDPQQSPYLAMQGKNTLVDIDTKALAKGVSQAKGQGAVTILSTTLSLSQAQQQLPLQHVDILIIESAYEHYGAPEKLGHTLVLQPGSRGQRLGRLDMQVGKHGNIVSFHHEVIELPQDVPDAARMRAWYDEYSDRLAQAYQQQTSLLKKAPPQQSPFMGQQACQSCHAEIHQIWRGSDHARAFDSLMNVNKAFDPNCIGCHTVAFGQPGGFIDGEATPDLHDVQCESCHGAGRRHVESGGAQALAHSDWPKEKICAQCHIRKHSPSFNYQRYWPKIVHGKNSNNESANP